jgi:hypothetical protein
VKAASFVSWIAVAVLPLAVAVSIVLVVCAQ